jgi:hypothetical protein
MRRWGLRAMRIVSRLLRAVPWVVATNGMLLLMESISDACMMTAAAINFLAVLLRATTISITPNERRREMKKIQLSDITLKVVNP